MKYLIPLLALLLLVFPAHATYSYSQSITIDHTKVGSSNSTNFTMLFGGAAGPYTALKTAANGGNIQNTVTFNGQTVPADLIFTSDSAGMTLINWEVASYTASTGAIEAWIQIPTLSHTANTVIYMFAGNASVTTYQGGAVGAAWDTYSNAVYHLANGSTLSGNDATSNAFNLTNSSAAAISGQIDGAANSNPGYLYNASGPAGNVTGNNLTLSSWINTASASGGIFGKWNSANSYFIQGSSGGGVEFWVHGVTYIDLDSVSSVSTGAWILVHCVQNSTGQYIYLNGVLNASQTGSSQSIASNTTDDLYIGARGTGGGISGWQGYLDEVRVASTNRSADWITAEYNNQSSPSTFYTLANIPGGSKVCTISLLGAGPC